MRTKLIILTIIAMALVVMAFPTNKFQPKTVWEHYCKYTLGIHPSQATDDQYYDYSPSQVEAILFGILQLTPEHQDYIITGLKKHLREFIQDDEQDEDMISQYTIIYNAIEKWESDHRETEIFQQLAVSEYVVSDTIWEEQDKLIEDLYYYFKS